MHWQHNAKMYYDEIPADSKEKADEYFIDHKRDDVFRWSVWNGWDRIKAAFVSLPVRLMSRLAR